jgi:hypothetical protein
METPLVDESEDRKEISFSKVKLLLAFVFTVFITITYPFLAVIYIWDTGVYDVSAVFVVIFCLGSLIITFLSGFFTIIIFFRILSNKPAYIISKTGVTFGVMGEEVLWSDVTDITVANAKVQAGFRLRKTKWKCIFLIVQNPDNYIDRQKSAFVRSKMKQTLEMNGTPIGIPVVGLNISLDELLKIMNEYYAMSQN